MAVPVLQVLRGAPLPPSLHFGALQGRPWARPGREDCVRQQEGLLLPSGGS